MGTQTTMAQWGEALRATALDDDLTAKKGGLQRFPRGEEATAFRVDPFKPIRAPFRNSVLEAIFDHQTGNPTPLQKIARELQELGIKLEIREAEGSSIITGIVLVHERAANIMQLLGL